MSVGFWLSDRSWAAIEPFLPTNQPGARRVDDRRVISGIIHVLRIGCSWGGLPSRPRPFDDDLQSVRPVKPSRSMGAHFQAIARSRGGPASKIPALTDSCGQAVAFTFSRGNHAHLSEAPALLDKGPAPTRLLADKGYDANGLRECLAATRTEAPSPTMHKPPATEISPNAPFVASRTGGASQPAPTD